MAEKPLKKETFRTKRYSDQRGCLGDKKTPAESGDGNAAGHSEWLVQFGETGKASRG